MKVANGDWRTLRCSSSRDSLNPSNRRLPEPRVTGGALRDPEAGEFAALTAAIEADDPLMLSLLYGDFEGGQRIISQFALRRGDGRWLTAAGRHFNVDRPEPR